MKRVKNLKIFIFILFFFHFVPLLLMAQNERGIPFLHYYSPKVYQAHDQSWTFFQDKRGILYVGNGDGLLQYDGVSWRLLQLPAKTIIRNFAVDSTGRIFYGSAADLGYVDTDSLGNLRIMSLLSKLSKEDRKFSDIWQTIVIRKDVYFSSYNKLFRYKNGRFKVWNSKASIHPIFLYKSQLYLKIAGKGIMKIDENDSIVPITFGDFFKDMSFNTVADFEGKVMVAVDKVGCFLYDPEQISDKGRAMKRFPTELDSLFRKSKVWSMHKLKNGYYSVSTFGKGVYIIDKNGKLITQLTKEIGLESEIVYDTYEDNFQNLWLATNKGVLSVDVSYPITLWDKRLGLFGTPEAIVRHKDVVYIATHQGIYYFKNNKINKIAGIDDKCWSFISYKEPNDTTKQHLLVGVFDGIYEIKDFKLNQIVASSAFAAEFLQSKKNPNRIFVTFKDGFGSLRHENGQFVFEGKLPNIKDDIRGIGEDEDGTIWLGTFRSGIFRVRFNDNNLSKPEIKLYQTEAGLKSLKNILVFTLKNKIVFGTENGLYQYDSKSDKFVHEKTLPTQFYNETRDIFWLLERPDGNVWLSGLKNNKSPIGIAQPKKEGGYSWFYQPFRLMPEMMVLAFSVENEGSAWIGGSEGLYRYDAQIKFDYLKNFNTILRKVSIGKDSVIFGGNFFDEKNGVRINTLTQNDFLKP